MKKTIVLLMMAATCTMIAAQETDSQERFLDYTSGEFFTGETTNRELWPEWYGYPDDEGITVEWNIRYAIVEDSPYYNGCVRWCIPEFNVLDMEGKPEIAFHGHYYELPAGYKSVSISLLEAEYKDFNYELQPALPPVLDWEPQRFVDIVPYTGFYPAETQEVSDIAIYRGIYSALVVTQPVQYDYQNHIVRAYTHLKYRIDYKEESGIEGFNADDTQAKYYNLQGIRIAEPQPGELYIERRGNVARKIRW